ncbi:MAG: pilus assembly protein TadG-related protein [Proteobacteria bacterium]|nr:pilus assembly protein TadG-related protein [Pseudomonadota bacterium]
MTHAVLASLRSVFRRWKNERQGSIAVMYSLALIPVISLFGLAVSFSDVSEKRSRYQRIADAAALAGATASATDADSARQARAKTWFNQQAKEANLPVATVNVAVTNGNVVVTATANYSPKFSEFLPGGWEISVTSTAQLATVTIRRVLDVVFCIDATGSMQNTINSVKARANSFSDDLNNALTTRGLEKFDYTRIRAVFYRDFAVDDDTSTYYWGYGWYKNPKPMSKSAFFEMPAGKSSLTTFLGTENAAGGGDLPESGYECINEGMNSAWWKKNDTIPGTSYKADAIYPVIVLWSDADALPINHGPSVGKPLYPANMPRSVTGFVANWNNSGLIDQANRMLVHFGLCNNNSWSTARSLAGYMCGGTLNDGNTNMVNKIADAMVVRYKNLNARLTR